MDFLKRIKRRTIQKVIHGNSTSNDGSYPEFKERYLQNQRNVDAVELSLNHYLECEKQCIQAFEELKSKLDKLVQTSGETAKLASPGVPLSAAGVELTDILLTREQMVFADTFMKEAKLDAFEETQYANLVGPLSRLRESMKDTQLIDRKRSEIKIDFDSYTRRLKHLRGKANLDHDKINVIQRKLNNTTKQFNELSTDLFNQFKMHNKDGPEVAVGLMESLTTLHESSSSKTYSRFSDLQKQMRITPRDNVFTQNTSVLEQPSPSASVSANDESAFANQQPESALSHQQPTAASTMSSVVRGSVSSCYTTSSGGHQELNTDASDVDAAFSSIAEEQQEMKNPLPTQKAVDVVVAKFEYKAQAVDELSLTIGDNITVETRFSDGWCKGTNQKGESGVFPGTYVG